MTDAHIWAAIAFVALCMFAAQNIYFARTAKSTAEAFSILEKMDDRFDARVRSVTEKLAQMLRKGKPEDTQTTTSTPLPPPEDAMTKIFGGPPLVPLDEVEQPEADERLAVFDAS